jgi:hypothetical protein
MPQEPSPATRSARSNRLRTIAGIGIADRVGQAHAVGAGVQHACISRSTSSGSTWPCSVQPKAVLMPTSISVFEPAASRAARMRPISATTSSGVLRRLARLCAWLADSGTSIRSAPAMARSAPFRLGTSTEARRPGSVLAKASSSAVSASCGSRRAGTKEPTSISRWPAACASRIHSSLRAVGRRRRCFAGRRAGPLRGRPRGAGRAVNQDFVSVVQRGYGVPQFRISETLVCQFWKRYILEAFCFQIGTP